MQESRSDRGEDLVGHGRSYVALFGPDAEVRRQVADPDFDLAATDLRRLQRIERTAGHHAVGIVGEDFVPIVADEVAVHLHVVHEVPRWTSRPDVEVFLWAEFRHVGWRWLDGSETGCHRSIVRAEDQVRERLVSVTRVHEERHLGFGPVEPERRLQRLSLCGDPADVAPVDKDRLAEVDDLTDRAEQALVVGPARLDVLLEQEFCVHPQVSTTPDGRGQ